MNDCPDHVGWFVIEVDVEADRNEPVHSFLSGPYPTKEKAEREIEGRREAWERALDEWGENPYDHKRFDTYRLTMNDWHLDRLEREDRESHEIKKRAAGAVAESLLAGDSDE